MLILMLWLSLASPSSQPASAPTVSVEPCDTDGASCWRTRWLLSDLKLALRENDLAAAQRSVASLTLDNAAIKAVLAKAETALANAAHTTDKIADAVGVPWYLSPWLWGPLGLVLGVGFTVTIVHFVAGAH